MTDIETDYSLRNTPDSWNQAAEEADNVPDSSPLGRRRVMPSIPEREQSDIVSGSIFGGLVGLAGGYVWYHGEVASVGQLAWAAPLLGAALAIVIRIAAGGRDSDVRATLAAVFYLLTVLGVAYLVERAQFIETYGDATQFWNSNSALIRNRISEPWTISSWLFGLILAVQLSYSLGNRRRR